MKDVEAFYRSLEEALELPEGSVHGSQDLANLNWDSMAVVSFIAFADSKYGVAIPVAQLQQARTVADLEALLP